MSRSSALGRQDRPYKTVVLLQATALISDSLDKLLIGDQSGLVLLRPACLITLCDDPVVSS